MAPKKNKGANLPARVPDPQQALTVEQVLAHPVVKQMSAKLEEMRALVAGLPEAVGRAVAAAQAANKRPVLSGPAVTLKSSNEAVEFHRKGKIVQAGKEIAAEGQTGGDFVTHLNTPREVPLVKRPRE